MKLAKLAVLLCALGVACAEAGGDVKGGGLTEAGAEAVIPGVFDGGATVEEDAGDGGNGCGVGDTWSSLYRDLFGPTGKPGSCTFQSDCHGSPGTKASEQGIQCFDEKGCRESMIAKGLWTAENAPKPENALGLSTIRNINPKTGKARGFMPKSPADYVFPDACIARLVQWIAKGVPAD